MLDEDERAAIAASVKDTYDRNMLIAMAPLFRAERIEWQILHRKIVFKQCTLRKPVHNWPAGEQLERIVISLDDKAWHARLYKSKEDSKNPVKLHLHATFGHEVINACEKA